MNSQKWLSLNYFIQFAVNGVFLPFWMLYLTAVKGLSILEASSIFSMLYLARFLSGVFLSPILIRKFNMTTAMKIATISGLIFAVSYSFTNEKILLFTITFMFGLTFYSLSPLTESLASIFLKEENIDYGHVRLFGSLSYMLLGIIVGSLIGYIGNNSLYYILVSSVGLYVIFLFLPTPKLVNNIKIEKEEKKTSKPYFWVLKDKSAIFLILAIFMYQVGHTAYNNYNAIYLNGLNVSAKWLIGFILNISVIAEIIFFMFAKKIPSSIKPTQLLIASGVFGVIRWLIIGSIHNIYVFTIMQTFHALTFGISQIAFILILNKRFNTEKILDMQNLYNAIGYQLSAFVGLYIVGYIWQINTSYVFYASALFAFLGILCALNVKDK